MKPLFALIALVALCGCASNPDPIRIRKMVLWTDKKGTVIVQNWSGVHLSNVQVEIGSRRVLGEVAKTNYTAPTWPRMAMVAFPTISGLDVEAATVTGTSAQGEMRGVWRRKSDDAVLLFFP